MDRLDVSGDCWLWTGPVNRGGYGYLSGQGEGGKSVLAHRLSYEVHVGPIPEGLRVLHTCDVPRCCRPEHLWVGSDADNNRDMWLKGRGFTATHCPRGHEYTPENTALSPWKKCRECARIWALERYRASRVGVEPFVRPELTHCPHGHEYTAENSYVRPNGGKVCRACRREAERRRSQAQRPASASASTEEPEPSPRD